MVRGGTGSADVDRWLFGVLPASGIGLHRVAARMLDSAGAEYVICTTSDARHKTDPPSTKGDRRNEPNADEHQPTTGWSRWGS